jgi:hypothetical protein
MQQSKTKRAWKLQPTPRAEQYYMQRLPKDHLILKKRQGAQGLQKKSSSGGMETGCLKTSPAAAAASTLQI